MKLKINIITLALITISLGVGAKSGAYLSENYSRKPVPVYDSVGLGAITAQQSWVESEYIDMPKINN